MKEAFIFLCFSFSLIAQVTLLPDNGKVERAIMDPIEAEAVFFDRVAAPYGKNFESWIGGEDFAKEMQSGAGGYKIWSERGEYLARGEVFYRWPVETLPEKGFLEIFSDDHAVIEILNEGRHLAAGKGNLVFDLSTLPSFYENLILRFSSRKAHRALVWANVYSEYEWVQEYTKDTKAENAWFSVDSKTQLKLKDAEVFRYKRFYHCDDDKKQYRLHFPSDIDEIWLNGEKVSYPQVLPKGLLKNGENELLYVSKTWKMGSDPGLIFFEELTKQNKETLQWKTLDDREWLYESSFYSGTQSDGGQKLIFNGAELDTVILKSEIICTQEDLDMGVNMLFRSQPTVPNSYWRTGESLVPPFIKVNGRSKLFGPHGLRLENVKLGKNIIEMQVNGKILKPYLKKGVLSDFNLRAPQHAYQFALKGKSLQIDLASQGLKKCELYVNNKKVFDKFIKKGDFAQVLVSIEAINSASIGAPDMDAVTLVFKENKKLTQRLDLNKIDGLSEILSYFLGCEETEAYNKFNLLRGTNQELTLMTLMPDGKPIGIYLYPHFRDQLISAHVNGKDVEWQFFNKFGEGYTQDRFEKRAYLEWVDAMAYEASPDKQREFNDLRFSYMLELYQGLKDEFTELER
ncbi:hypothetical protein PQO01_01835 [Lentisphaera marina]|uniref:hypothetical protein n=1 Tax=Lentisphaera marina TaxID=1111041 RepID=UPI00236570AC|nr:hypothetical protein [Lentisphaera marina]MDD7983689.1 hypothetical protein [Lentisphaera marina]